MTEKQVAQIKVSRFGVGIIGIRGLMEEMAQGYADKNNKEIQEHMLEQLGMCNYIPSGAGRSNEILLDRVTFGAT